MKHFSHPLLSKKMLPLVVVAVFLLVQAAALIAPFKAKAAPTISTATTGTMLSLSTKTISYNAGTGSGRVLIVVVASDDRTKLMTDVSYGGVSMAQQSNQLAGGTAVARVQVFALYGVDLASGVNSLTFTASGADNYAYVIAYISGAGDTPIGTLSTNSASTGSSLSVSNTPQSGDSLVVAGFASDSTTAFTPGAGSNEIGEVSAGSGGVRAGLYTRLGPPAPGPSVSIGATGGTAGWAAGAVEIKVPVVLPDLTATSLDESAAEPGGAQAAETGSFTVTRSGSDRSSSLGFNFTLDGTATKYDDYYVSPQDSTCSNVTGDSATIPSDAQSCTLVIRPEEDQNSEEGTEYVDLQLNAGDEYNLGEGISSQVYIQDYVPAYLGGTDPYSVQSPGYETMSLYDDDVVPSGTVVGLTAVPARVQPGGTATLSWSVVGMTSCSINNGIGAVDAADGPHSAQTGPVSTRTTFILSCTDTAATHEYSVVVGIVPSFIEQ